MGTNYIDSLLASIEDESVRERLTKEVNKLRDNKEFGLVFERHIPEYVRLPQHKITEGATVQIRAGKGDEIYSVRSIQKKQATIVDSNNEDKTLAAKDLIIVSRHGDPIFPGLTEVGNVERGGDKPFHTVINAENYHALQLLLYTHEGKVDCIYIDPPYNTGAKDWKYNNDYVDSEDRYRHSKWLSFMEKRLKLARRLLKPEDSVLICTIDEKEYLRLGLLLEDLFPHSHIQMVSSVISSKGVAREVGINRVDEYIFFVFFGSATLTKLDPIFCGHERTAKKTQVWYPMIRTGSDPERHRAPGCFYPILVDPSNGKITGCGIPLEKNEKRSGYKPPDNRIAFFPLAKDGSESRWQMGTEVFKQRLDKGLVKLGQGKKLSNRPVMYIRSGMAKRIENGEVSNNGINSLGVLEVDSFEGAQVQGARSQWNNISHDASLHGTNLNKLIMPDRKFPYPKSLFAVEDTLRWYLLEKKDAVVLDFFAGSGTTTHAVMRLNKQDNGRRISISITNNALSDSEHKRLIDKNNYPGSSEYESQGIFEMITKPRIVAALTGVATNGEKIKGKYGYTDIFPMSDGFSENVKLFNFELSNSDDISRNKSFGKIAPLLWMISGSVGSVIEEVSETFELQPEGRYGILYDLTHWQEFVDAVKEVPTMTHVFIITDSKVQYQQIVNHLTTNIHSTMLYEDYLRNFQIGV